MSSSHHLTLQIGPHDPYRKSNEVSQFGEARVISRNHSPSLSELGPKNDLLQVDLGPQFGIDDSDFDLVFELDLQSPLSPFSDDQDDSDRSASNSTSYRHFPTFDSLSSLLFLDDESYSGLSLGTNSMANEAHIYHNRYIHKPFDLIRSTSDGQLGHTSIVDEDLRDWDFSMGDVVFDIFIQDLQRTIPGDVLFEFDAACLKELDARLLLAPAMAFEDICWAEISQPNDSRRWKPLPDVPASMAENGIPEMWHMEHDYPPRSPYWTKSSSSSNIYYDLDSAGDTESDYHPFAMDDRL